MLVDGELRCTVNGKSVRFIATGDCCSTGWISDLVSVPLPATIVEVEPNWGSSEVVESGYPGYPPPDEYPDVVKVYDAAIKTSAGDIAFKVWNNSNGYYGSSLEVVE